MPRGLSGGDSWADWYGNLEVSVPLPAHPSGRVIHGKNLLTGATFHPDVVAFLAAQGDQDPVWIDTSWLLIKHVDEIVAFLPGADGRGAILVPDPEEGLRLAEPAAAADPAGRRRAEANRRIARIIDTMLSGGPGGPRAGGTAAAGGGAAIAGDGGANPGLLALLGWDASRVVRLPVAFDVPESGLLADGGVTGASAVWSDPVNALVVNGTVICGSAGMPGASARPAASGSWPREPNASSSSTTASTRRTTATCTAPRTPAGCRPAEPPRNRPPAGDARHPQPDTAVEHVCRRTKRRSSTLETLGVSSGRPRGTRSWMTFSTDS